MAKLTKEQVVRWNAKLQNGFKFDVAYFMNWGEKQVLKRIELDGGKILEAKIIYRDTGRCVRPALHLQVWRPASTPGMMCSGGMGAYIDIGEDQDKRKYNELVKLSSAVTEEKIMEYAKERIGELRKETIF